MHPRHGAIHVPFVQAQRNQLLPDTACLPIHNLRLDLDQFPFLADINTDFIGDPGLASLESEHISRPQVAQPLAPP